MVNRFETVIAEEIQQYSLTVVRQNNEISSLKSLLESILRDQKEWNTKHLQSNKDCLDGFAQEKKDLFEKNEEHRRFINEKVSFLNKDIEYLKQLSVALVKKDDLIECVLALKSKITDLEVKADLENKRMRELVDSEKQQLLSEIEKIKEDLILHKKDVQTQHEEQEKKIDSQAIDAQGVLRELQIYKKSMFIIEKKIENIYTLIKRLEERISL